MSMKNLALVCLLSLPIIVYSQNQKAAQSSTNSKISVDEQIKLNAGKWFKEFYVESKFKDPYSYKLLKIESEKVTIMNAVIDSLHYLDIEIANCKIAEVDRNQESRDSNQQAYNKHLEGIKRAEEKLKTEKDASERKYYQNLIAVFTKYALIRIDFMEQYDILIWSQNEKKRLQKRFRELKSEELDKLSYYRIRIDCYSKNSLGNEVLGRFQFPFSEKGAFGIDNGLHSVTQLNKE